MTHGTSSGYLAGCRLECCRSAHRARQKAFARRLKLNRGRSFRVDAQPVREHLRWLSRHGVGYKSVARTLGVSASNLAKLEGLWDGKGSWSNGPTKRVSRVLADRILALRPGDFDGGQKVNAASTWVLIDRLVARGWPKAELARRITGPQARCLQISRGLVRASTAAKVRRVYAELVGLAPVRVARNTRVTVRDPRGCELCGTPWRDHSLMDSCERRAS